MEKGLDSGVLIPARKEIMETREALDISLAALKATSEGHSRAREESQHALDVGMRTATSLPKFIQNDDGGLGETEREAQIS